LVSAQKIQVVSQGLEPDSSFYHVTKINNNEFWAGGEYGILKKIDSLGNVGSLNFPNDGKGILKIERVKNYVFVVTNNAVIYRYDIEKKIFIKKTFPNFKNKCFYDFIVLQNGQLLVCGGTSGISEGQKKIPRGFIALLDQELEKINIVWKCYRKFVWSLLELENGEVLAATFNGKNSKIIKSKNYNNWKIDTKIKGLVHEIAIINNEIWYAGTASLHFNRNGIFGIKNQNSVGLNKTGCLWSMDMFFGKMITVTNNGKLLILDKNNVEIKQIDTPSPYAIYDIVKIAESKILIVGHGKTMYIIDFDK
jgi:hypothetical protein